MKICLNRLRELISYDPDTGEFIRRDINTAGNKRYIGKKAGWATQRGYWQISVDGKAYQGHRLAWFYTMGLWPTDQIDHINGNRSDSRWVNLREASGSQNQHNQGCRLGSRSRYKGVTWLNRKNPWRASITFRGKRVHLGCFATQEQAFDAYVNAAKKYHGEFARFYRGYDL